MSAEIRPTTTEQLLEMAPEEVAKRLDHLKTIREVRVLESYLRDEFGGSDAMFRMRRDRYGGPDGTRWVPIDTSSNRKGGANRPIFYNETELNELRQKSRVLLQTNPYAKGLHRNLLNYTIGKGMTYTVKPRGDEGGNGSESEPPSPEVKARVKQIQKWVNGWLGRNRWTATIRDPRSMQKISQSREREMVSRVFRDGEAFIRLHDLGNGDSAARFVEPVQITNPQNATEFDGWLYGIEHQTDPFVDVETEIAFWCKYWDKKGVEDGEKVPASEIVHVMLEDEDAVSKRGISLYADGVERAFERAWKLQDTTSRTAEFQSGNAEMWASDTGTPQGGMTAFGREGGGGGQFIVDKFAPPPRIRYMSGRTPVTPTAMNLMEFGGVAQRDLMQAAAVVSAPEYLVSGDASNANYASTEQAGTPFVLGNSVAQEHFATASISVLYRAIMIAVEAGKLPADTLDLIELHVETTKDDSREPLERAQEDQILTGGKPLKSPQTAMRERGLDPDQQFREMDEWNERYGNQGQPLDPNADPYADQGQQRRPVPESVLEDIEPSPLARLSGGGFVDLKNERESGGAPAGATEYHFNPSRGTLGKALKTSESGGLRLLADDHNMIAWDSERAMHPEMAHALGISDEHFAKMHPLIAEPHGAGIRLLQLGKDSSWAANHPQLKRLGGRVEQLPGTKGPSLIAESVEALLEGYDPKATLAPSDIQEDDPDHVWTRAKIGEHTYQAHAYRDDPGNRWDVRFDREDPSTGFATTQDIKNDTGTSATRVFAHVGKLVSHVMQKHDPDAVTFEGFGGKRAALYDHFAQQIAQAHGRVLEKRMERGGGAGKFKIVKEPSTPEGGWNAKMKPSEFASSVREKHGDKAGDRLKATADQLRDQIRAEKKPEAVAALKNRRAFVKASLWHLKFADQKAGKPPAGPVAESILVEELPVYRDAATRPDVEDPTPLPQHIQETFDKLPAPVRVPLAKAHGLLMAGHHAALNAAKSVAAEKGLTPEQTDKLGKRLGQYDLMFSGGAKVAALSGLHAAAPLAAIPAASLGYLTYSLARNPIATARAASKGVKSVIARVAPKGK